MLVPAVSGCALVRTPGTAYARPMTPAGRDPAAQRRAFGAVLRARRERLTPEDAGLPSGGRRRTPGLRREEVAMLAGVSTTYYTYLEQGRDVRPSVQVLECLVRALRMTPVERAQMFELAHGTPPPHGRAPLEEVHESVRMLLRALDPTPAYLVGWRWDVLAQNTAARIVFGRDFSLGEGLERNTAWWMITDPAAKELMRMDTQGQQRMLARLRSRTERYRHEPAMRELEEALGRAAPCFAEWWERQEVLPSVPLTKQFDHPTLGTFELGQVAMDLAHAPDQRIVTLPAPVGSRIEAQLSELVAAENDAARAGRLVAA